MAYAPTGGLYVSALAGFACAAMNRGLTWLPTSPQLAAIEASAIEWMVADVCGWAEDARGGGIFTSGGSVANSLGLHVGRVAAAAAADPGEGEGEGEGEAATTFFVAEGSHYCIANALRVLGVRHVRPIATKRDGAIDLVALQADLASLRPGVPAMIVATAGKTSNGAIDDMASLAAARDTHRANGGGCWLHVDACYGGFFALTAAARSAEGREGCVDRAAAAAAGDGTGLSRLRRGLAVADSVALDPHKALQLPYGVGSLLVRGGKAALKRAFYATGDYCPPGVTTTGSQLVDGSYSYPENLSELSLELTREARGAQVWLPLRAYGVDAFAHHLNWCLESAQWLAEAIDREAVALRAVETPTLSVVNLAFSPHFTAAGLAAQPLATGPLATGPPATDVNFEPQVTHSEMIEWLVNDVNARGRALVAPTMSEPRVDSGGRLLDASSSVRICILSCRTSPSHMAALLDDLLHAEAAVLAAAATVHRARTNPHRALGFLVPYRIEYRPGKGICVVASRAITAGEPVWAFRDGACLPVSEASIAELAARHEVGKATLGAYLKHCFPWNGQLWYPQGDTQFFNTSGDPSIRPAGDGTTWIAARPIGEGEEITDDYSTYDNGTFPWCAPHTSLPSLTCHGHVLVLDCEIVSLP